MRKISFSDLPRGLRQHLLERVQEREIALGDLGRLHEWVKSEPFAPDGDWYQDFGSSKLCGSNKYPKTVLTKGMTAFGKRVEQVKKEGGRGCLRTGRGESAARSR